jgi:tetratricopeptide (TPR) repeat protein
MEAFDAAVEINPSYEFARRARAHTLAYLGRLGEARDDIDHALDVDPLNAQVTHIAGQVYEWNGDAERATELYQEATALDSGNPNGRHSLGLLLCMSGKAGARDEGIALLEEARRISNDDPLIVGDLGWCFAAAGRTEDARALLAELEMRTATEWVSPVALARIQIGLGEGNHALSELERAFEVRAYRIVTLDVEPRWDPIRADPRFEKLRQRVGLPRSTGAASI